VIVWCGVAQADEVLAQAQGIFAKLQQQLNHHGATLSGFRDKLQPTLMTAKAAISARQIAESKAEDALVTRGSLSAQLEAQSQAVTRLQADLQRTREEASLLAKRNDSLAEINRSLALEVEEKRNVIESVIVEKERLLEDSERLRQAVLQRDGQLAEYMSQLTSQLQVVGGAKPLSSSTGGARQLFSVTQPSATEQHAVVRPSIVVFILVSSGMLIHLICGVSS
jgi:chromosome segregation ATPase